MSGYYGDIWKESSWNEGYLKTREEKTLVVRRFPLNPFDDIEIDLEVSKRDNPLDGLKVELVGYDKNGTRNVFNVCEEEVKVSPLLNNILEYRYSTGTYDYIKCVIKGWNNDLFPGIANSKENLKKLIETGKIKAEVFESGKTGRIGESSEYRMDLCVPIWGNIAKRPEKTDGFNINFAFGKSMNLYVTDILQEAKAIREKTFLKYDPFPKYPENFAYYADVSIFDDLGYKKGEEWKMAAEVKNDTSCRNSGYNVYSMTSDYSNLGISTSVMGINSLLGFYMPGLNVISVNGKSNDSIIQEVLQKFKKAIGNADELVVPSHSIYSTYMHEFGHYFGLSDEYQFSNDTITTKIGKFFGILSSNKPNCSSDSKCSEFTDLFKNYSDSGGCWQGCIHADSYRSTKDSMMNFDVIAGYDKFNNLSCAVILKKIDPSSNNDDNWEKCTKMDVVGGNACNIAEGGNCEAKFIENGIELKENAIKNSLNNKDVIFRQCSTCSIGGNCLYLGNNADCGYKVLPQNEDGKIIGEYGICTASIDKSNGKNMRPFDCQLHPEWECNYWGGCSGNEICKVSTHKCIPLDSMGTIYPQLKENISTRIKSITDYLFSKISSAASKLGSSLASLFAADNSSTGGFSSSSNKCPTCPVCPAPGSSCLPCSKCSYWDVIFSGENSTSSTTFLLGNANNAFNYLAQDTNSNLEDKLKKQQKSLSSIKPPTPIIIFGDPDNLSKTKFNIQDNLRCQIKLKRSDLVVCTVKEINQKLKEKSQAQLPITNLLQYNKFKDIINKEQTGNPWYKTFSEFNQFFNTCIANTIKKAQDAENAREDAIKQKKTEEDIKAEYVKNCTPKSGEAPPPCAEAELIYTAEENGEKVEQVINSGYFSYTGYDEKTEQWTFEWKININPEEGQPNETGIASSKDQLEKLKGYIKDGNNPKINCRATNVITNEVNNSIARSLIKE